MVNNGTVDICGYNKAREEAQSSHCDHLVTQNEPIQSKTVARKRNVNAAGTNGSNGHPQTNDSNYRWEFNSLRINKVIQQCATTEQGW